METNNKLTTEVVQDVLQTYIDERSWEIKEYYYDLWIAHYGDNEFPQPNNLSEWIDKDVMDEVQTMYVIMDEIFDANGYDISADNWCELSDDYDWQGAAKEAFDLSIQTAAVDYLTRDLHDYLESTICIPDGTVATGKNSPV